MLTDWRKDLDLTPLAEDQSVSSFRTLDEMVEKVEFYLSNPDRRDAVSKAGREIVLDKMTYRHVAGELAKQIESVLDNRPGGESIHG